MWVKLCGTTTLEDAQLAVAAGADAIGFVFAESKRRVTPAKVAEITAELPATIEKIGVFEAHTADEILAAVRQAGLTGVQIHRTYDSETTHTLRKGLGPECKLFQVVACSIDDLDADRLRSELQAALTDQELWAILLDASRAGVSGGTGQSFDWTRVAEILDQVWPGKAAGEGPKLILAGGLRPENLRQAIATLRPFGVDVVSGVERVPGRKDPERVCAFVAAARCESFAKA